MRLLAQLPGVPALSSSAIQPVGIAVTPLNAPASVIFIGFPLRLALSSSMSVFFFCTYSATRRLAFSSIVSLTAARS